MQARIGQQSLSLEDGSLLAVRLSGEVTAQEMVDCMATVDEWASERSYLLMLVDVSELIAISPGARRAVGQKPVPPQMRQAFACLGASFRTRVVLGLLVKAMQLIKRQPFELEFFPSEADARAWLAETRSRFTAEACDRMAVQ